MSSLKKSSTRRSDDTMDDDSDDKDSKRKSRNLSEKKRRDQFNLLVNELSSMVATTGRKMDKSTVLKSTISFLKNHNEVARKSKVNEIQEDWKPTFLTNEEFTHLILEAVDGFIMVFSASGHIYYASESITSLLGHLPNDLLNMTIYEMTNEEEHSELYSILLSPSEDDGQVSFSCHLRRGGPDTKQPPSYELVHFVGYFRSDEDMVQNENRYSGYSGEADTRLVFVGTGRIQTPQLIREMPLVDSSKSEFISRHSLEWKFLFLDHRAPPIIGYLPFELLGTSGYDYYHVDDLESVVTSHEALMKKGEGTSCFYRFLTKGQQWIWLQTRFFITYHQWNSKPEFVVCTHRVISYVDVMKLNRKDDSIIVDGTSISSPVGNGTTSPFVWPSKKANSPIRHTNDSDCTSMSGDLPSSCQSVVTQLSVKSKSSRKRSEALQQHHQNQQDQQPHQQQSHQQQQQHQQPPPQQQHQEQQQITQAQPVIQQAIEPQITQQFLESPPYITSIPIQPMISGFPPTVLSPLPAIDNVIVGPVQAQMQMDLQRKHAELQAIIGQQQAELRRVSEQLLMARLGVISRNSAPPLQNVTITYGANPGTVSSTTSIQCIPQISTPGPPSIVVHGSAHLPSTQHQQPMNYNPTDSADHKE